MELLEAQLLENYIRGFYGYGNYSGRYWFIGMEEGGGRTIEENVARIRAWERGGKEELEDLVEKHNAVGISRYSRERPPLQRTWAGLIRLLKSVQGVSAGNEEIRHYQRNSLGKHGGENCLIELLPLPSPSTRHWIYGQISSLPQLRTREEYGEYYVRARAAHIREQITKYKPALVVFYGVNAWYRQWWEYIAGVKLDHEQTAEGAFYVGSKHGTVFAVIKHPASKGLKNEYFRLVGNSL